VVETIVAELSLPSPAFASSTTVPSSASSAAPLTSMFVASSSFWGDAVEPAFLAGRVVVRGLKPKTRLMRLRSDRRIWRLFDAEPADSAAGAARAAAGAASVSEGESGDEFVDVSVESSAYATPGLAATASPTPSDTAKAPTLPT
jgi:hypothetical protein